MRLLVTILLNKARRARLSMRERRLALSRRGYACGLTVMIHAVAARIMAAMAISPLIDRRSLRAPAS